MTNRHLQAAEQLRRTMQKYAMTLSKDEVQEIACVFDPWQAGRRYAPGDRFTYGVNAVGDPQLYEAVQYHTSEAGNTPDKVPALYEPIGLSADGYPVWAEPSGAHDAYDVGDIVDYGGVLYESLMDGNTTVPGSDERFWREVSNA